MFPFDNWTVSVDTSVYFSGSYRYKLNKCCILTKFAKRKIICWLTTDQSSWSYRLLVTCSKSVCIQCYRSYLIFISYTIRGSHIFSFPFIPPIIPNNSHDSLFLIDIAAVHILSVPDWHWKHILGVIRLSFAPSPLANFPLLSHRGTLGGQCHSIARPGAISLKTEALYDIGFLLNVAEWTSVAYYCLSISVCE